MRHFLPRIIIIFFFVFCDYVTERLKSISDVDDDDGVLVDSENSTTITTTLTKDQRKREE